VVLTAALLLAAACGQTPTPGPVLTEFIFEEAVFPQCHASTLVELPEGDLLAAWFGGTEEGHKDVAIWASRRSRQPPPGAPAWSPPRKVAYESGAASWNPVLFRDRDGRIWLFFKVGPSPERWTGAYSISTDQGSSFGPPSYLPAGLLGPIKNKPLLLADGSLLCGSSVESYRSWSVWLERLSADRKSWTKVGPITVPGHPRGIIQPSLFTGDAAGEIVMLTRSRGIGRVCRSSSADGGLNWSPAEATPLPNPNSGLDCVRLKDGRVVLVYNPSQKGRTPLSLAISSDLGKSWSPSLVLERSAGEYSYPAVIELSSLDLAVTYTHRRTRIRFARIPLAALVSERAGG
jgi:predicted neuraminidase